MLKMMNPPTRSPTPAKPSSASFSEPSRSSTGLPVSLATAAADETSNPPPKRRPAGVERALEHALLGRGGGPGRDADVDRVVDPGRVEHALGRVRIEGREAHRAEVRLGPELEEADELELLGLALEQDLHPVADLEPVAPRGPDVHCDLAVVHRSLPLGDPRRPDLVTATPRDPEGRRAGRLDRRLAVLADELRVALQEPVRGGDARDVAHRLDQILGQALAGGRGVVERRPGPHHEVHPGRVLREQGAEGVLQGVGEDVGAAHERHPEHHSEGGQRKAHLPGEHALDRRPPHPPHPAPGHRGLGHHPAPGPVGCAAHGTAGRTPRTGHRRRLGHRARDLPAHGRRGGTRGCRRHRRRSRHRGRG